MSNSRVKSKFEVGDTVKIKNIIEIIKDTDRDIFEKKSDKSLIVIRKYHLFTEFFYDLSYKDIKIEWIKQQNLYNCRKVLIEKTNDKISEEYNSEFFTK